MIWIKRSTKKSNCRTRNDACHIQHVSLFKLVMVVLKCRDERTRTQTRTRTQNFLGLRTRTRTQTWTTSWLRTRTRARTSMCPKTSDTGSDSDMTVRRNQGIIQGRKVNDPDRFSRKNIFYINYLKVNDPQILIFHTKKLKLYDHWAGSIQS